MSKTNQKSFQCVMCEENTGMICLEEKVPLCCMSCKKDFVLNGGLLSIGRRPKFVRCEAKIEKISDLPDLDNSNRPRYDDGNKKLVITFDDGKIEEIVKPFISKMSEYSFIIYDQLNISIDRLREHPTTIDLFNFVTGRYERLKNKIFQFPDKSFEGDRKIVSFQCRGDDGPIIFFDVSIQNLREGTGSYHFTDVITRIMLRYPLTDIY